MSAPGLAPSHLEAILDSCPDPIVGETVDGVINYWNAAAEQFYGYSADEVVGKPLSILAPEDREAELENLLHRMQQGQMVEAYETVRRARDGCLLDVSLTIFPVLNEAGQIVGAAATTRDITQRKRDAAALAASERRFRAAFDDAPNGMALIGLDGEILQVNRAGCELLGYAEGELRQMTVTDVIHAEDRESAQVAREQTISSGGWGHTREMRMVHRSGSLRWISMQASLVRNEQGAPAYFIVQAEDLTERVRARESLSSARILMQETLERVGGAFIAVDSNWHITQVNATAEELVGWSRDSLLGRVLQEMVDPDLLQPLVDAITTTLTGRHQTHFAEFPYPPRQAWFTLRAYATAEGVSLFIRDVTRLRDLEQELRIAEMRFQALVEQLPAAVYMHADDDDETMIYISPYFEELTGFSIERDDPCRTVRDWLDLIHPDDRERVLQEGKTFDHEKNHLAQEYRFRRADGSYIWVSDNYAAMLDDAGQIIAWQGVMVDITAGIEAREAVSRLASIVEASDDAIFSRTLVEGIITYWNPAAERLYGYTASEAVGQPLTMLFVDKTEPLVTDPDTFKLLPSQNFESCHVRKDGKAINVSVTLFPIRDAEGNVSGISGIVRDISDRILAEQELRLALDAAETGVRAKGLFLAMMSHELRTPLQAVLGYADFLLSGRQGELSLAQNQDIGYIHLGASRMVHQIKQMLDLSRMEAGRLDLKREPVDLKRVVETVRQDIAPLAEAKGITLTITAPSRLPQALGDTDRVRQILLNLGGNAVKFTESGEVRISMRAQVGRLEVAVQDTGIGISPAELPHIFEEFRQVDSNLSRRQGGAGLGLAIAQRLAEQMGGAISVASQPGVGSTFTLRLPGVDSMPPKNGMLASSR